MVYAGAPVVRRRRIFAMGGGGFTMEPRNPRSTTSCSASPPRASRACSSFHRLRRRHAQIRPSRRFADALPARAPAAVFTFVLAPAGSRQIVLEQDIVYVGGGSMRNMLAIFHAHGLDRLLVRAWERDRAGRAQRRRHVLVRSGVTAQAAAEPIAGLGCSRLAHGHPTGEPERLPCGSQRCATAAPRRWAVDDGVGLLFCGRTLGRVVSSRPGAPRSGSMRSRRARALRLVPELLGRHDVSLGAPTRAVEELRHCTGARGLL